MGASQDGPRDYKIEYSVDEGVTWKAFSENETEQGCITSAGNIVTVFKKILRSIDRDYTTKKCVWNVPAIGLYNYEYDMRMYDDIYFKISIDSDYKVDGTQGIIGSDKGEIAIYDIRLFAECLVPDDSLDDSVTQGQPEQPDTGKTEVTSQPVSVNQEKNIALYNPGSSGENAEQPKEKSIQIIRGKNTKKTYTISQIKKKARSFVINISASGAPEVSFKKISGSKRLSIQKKTGKVIVKKGTKKGLYKMKVKIKVNKTKEYQEKTVTKTITVRVK